MKVLSTYSTKRFVKHLLFWTCVFLFFVLTASMDHYSGYGQVVEFNIMVVVTQIITAYVCINILIPRFLNKKKVLLFAFLLFVLLVAMFAVYNLFKMVYYDPKYFDTYNEAGKLYAQESFLVRVTNFSVFLSKCIKFLTPTALLLMAQFYENQQQFLKLKEQKRTAELMALKHQLNPHFLFNTLNNLYSLSLEKSDKTPMVIERLSDILDYILYRCKDTYVAIQKEEELIENYLTLEKVRYGNRVDISFRADVGNDVRIAPLILLTFVENAFKHGVSQELKKARIEIDLETKDNKIFFRIFNTKPVIKPQTTQGALGLKNVKKQLELLYPNAHTLEIDDGDDGFLVSLIVKQY